MHTQSLLHARAENGNGEQKSIHLPKLMDWSSSFFSHSLSISTFRCSIPCPLAVFVCGFNQKKKFGFGFDASEAHFQIKRENEHFRGWKLLILLLLFALLLICLLSVNRLLSFNLM
jgi:hypothetical protein